MHLQLFCLCNTFDLGNRDNFNCLCSLSSYSFFEEQLTELVIKHRSEAIFTFQGIKKRPLSGSKANSVSYRIFNRDRLLLCCPVL